MGIRRLIDRRPIDRSSYVRHFKREHALPNDAIDAADAADADLRSFHDDEHANDAALGLGCDAHGDL
jgi:hypothetical protein